MRHASRVSKAFFWSDDHTPWLTLTFLVKREKECFCSQLPLSYWPTVALVATLSLFLWFFDALMNWNEGKKYPHIFQNTKMYSFDFKPNFVDTFPVFINIQPKLPPQVSIQKWNGSYSSVPILFWPKKAAGLWLNVGFWK